MNTIGRSATLQVYAHSTHVGRSDVLTLDEAKLLPGGARRRRGVRHIERGPYAIRIVLKPVGIAPIGKKI
jgi:hypothetical protein